MATKKITELPFINTLSGSSVFDNPTQNTVVPVVLYGTTNQITVENFSKFTNLYAAQTGSQNIFTDNQWFNTIVSASTINVGTLGVGGNTTIAGTLDVGGNGTIGGNLAVAGRITAEEFYTEITTASVIYASGSTKFGDDTGDTHEFTGSINVSGSVIYNGVILSNIDANTIQKLQQTTQSLQVATASLQTFTASQDDRNFILSQITASFAGEIGGLEEYTASLKTAAIVSSSTQILNYNIFATTASNTFVGNQNITGSLSISAGEFNVISGSGELTSSLSFTHTTIDPITGNATLALRYRNNDVGPENNAWRFVADDGGVKLSYDQYATSNKLLFSVSSLGSNFDKLFIWRDARLYGKGLTVDDSLLVKGVITGSLLATNGVVSSSNQLFELNQFTASQDDRNFVVSQVTGSLIGITNGLMAFTAALDNTYATDAQLYQLYQATRSLELHSGSMIGVTNGLMAYTASNTSFNTGLRGEVDGIEAYTASLKGQAIVSSSTQVQNYDIFGLNSNLYTATGSLIGITNGLMAFTAALDSTYATDAQLFQLYQATRSIELTTGSLIGITNGLMAFTASLDNTFATDVQLLPILQATRSLELLSGSLIGITNGLMAFTAALDSTYATDAQLYQLYQATQSLELHSGSMIGITNALMAFTAALDSTYATDAQLYQLYAETASIKAEIGGIEAYTASLKGAAIVSSSQQITNYYKFAETASANTFYGNQSISGNAIINGGNSVRLYESTNTNYWDAYTYTDNTLRVNYNGAGGDEIILYNDAGVNFAGSITGSKNLTVAKAAIGSTVTPTIPLEVYGQQKWFTTTGDGSELRGFFNPGGAADDAQLTLYKADGTTAGVKITPDGIDFSANSNAAGMTSELLNDYEEGTWTPQIYYQNATDQTNSTNVTQVGTYTKIGRQVTVSGVLQWTITGSPAVDNIGIKNLPFTSVNSSDYFANGVLQLINADTYPSPPVFIQVQSNSTITEIYGLAGANNLGSSIGSSGTKTARFSITYFV